MRRCVLAILTLLGLYGFGVSVSAGQDKKGPLKIEYHGQSHFTITTTKGKTIAFDPHAVPAYYPNRFIILKDVDVICISHNHSDHIRTEIYKKTKDQKILRGLKTLSLKSDWAVVDEKIDDDIRIYNVNTYHDENEGLNRGKNAAFVVEVDGWRFCHLGDLGHQLSKEQLKKIGAVDVLMIPVGGIYTLNGDEAKKVVAQIKPTEYIFPMHFGTKEFEDILPIDEFLEGQPKAKVIRLSDSELDSKKRQSSVNLIRGVRDQRPLIVQLHYWSTEPLPKEEKKDEKKDEKK